MEKCLVTKLKASVNDLYAPVFKGIRIKCDASSYPVDSSVISNAIFNGEVTFKLQNPKNYFTDSLGNSIGTEQTFINKTEGRVYAHLVEPDCLIISPKYEITEISCGVNPVYCYADDFKKMSSLKKLSVTNMQGDINNLDINENITHLSFYGITPSGVITGATYGTLENLTKYKQLITLSIANSLISGNIETLAPLIETTEINITGCKKLYGDIKHLADKMYEAGRTSGTLKIWTKGSPTGADEKVTYDGKYFNKRVWTIVFSADGHSDTNTDS